MNQWKALWMFLTILIVQILILNVRSFRAVKEIQSDDDDDDDVIEVSRREDNEKNDKASRSEKRTWGHHGWFYRPRYHNHRIPDSRYRSRAHRYNRRQAFVRYPHGFRKVYRYRRPPFRPTTAKPTTTSKHTTSAPKTTPQPACYREGATVIDLCERQCVCRNDKLTDCYRVRREFTHGMCKRTRLRYLNAVVSVSTREPYKTRYEKLLTLHKIQFNNLIHKAPYFLPWHRWFVLQYENLLREWDCRITVPYWDFSLVAADPFNSEFWNDTYGFGGNGKGFPNCVKTGPFSVANNWKVIQSAGGGCLQRSFAETPGIIPDVVAVAKLLAKNLSQFSDFEIMLRINMHDFVHYAIGGFMITTDTATAPEFFPFHSFIDKQWSQWQAKSNFHRFHASFLAQNTSMPGMNHTSAEFLNNDYLPGCVKIRYAPPEMGDWNGLLRQLTKMAESNPKELDKLPRTATATLNNETFDVFVVSEQERERAKKMQEDLRTKVEIDPNQLKGMEKWIGIKATDIQKMKNTLV